MRKSFRSRTLGVLALLAFAAVADPGHASDGATAARPVETKPAGPGQAITVEPAPGWVRERVLPQATKARTATAQSGVAYLLNDQQYLTRPDGHDDWFRLAGQVTNRSGLEGAGQIAITYNPSFETPAIVFVHLIRDGKIIDLTPETEFRVVERETELDDGIVSGELKSIANLRDVRVGDIVDYATVLHARSVLWPGSAFYHLSQRYSDPLAKRTVRLVWPAASTPRYKTINSDLVFQTTKTPEGTEWEWMAEDPPAMATEKNVPDTAFQWGLIDISTMKDWAELAGWAVRLYQGDDSLPDDFAARLDAIAKASPAQGERLTEALRFVQDNIRYVGEEMGEGSYVPRRPRTVLARGYGDCKDKSLLLAVALRRLGIDATPALVSTDAGARLPDRLPSPRLFDHVIVRAVIDGKVMWIDPTGTHRGGRGAAIVPSDLGFGLPIRAGQTSLEPIVGFGDHAGRETIVERFDVDEEAETPLKLSVKSLYTDARADAMRARFANSSARKFSDANLEFYHQRFPGLVESKPLEVIDDREANIFTIIETYTMSRAEFDKAHVASKFVTRAYAMQDLLPDRQANPRVRPLEISEYRVNEQTIEVRVKNRVIDGLDDVDMKAGPISFSRRSSKLPDGLRMVYRLDTGVRDDVPAKDAEAIYALSDRIKDATGIEFYLDKAARAPSTPKSIDTAVWTPIRAQMEKISALMQKSDQPSLLEALSLLAEVAGQVPHPSPVAGLIDGMKGGVLAELQRPQAALAALQAATTQYDGNPPVYRLWIAYELDLGTAESVTGAIKRTRALHPEVVAALDKLWVRVALQKARALPPERRVRVREDLCIALADAGWQLDPRTEMGANMLGCALAARSLRGEVAEARVALAKDPPTTDLFTLAIDRRHQALWPDIDRVGADRFRKSLEREADRAAAAAKAAPKDYATVSKFMASLRALGRFQDALAAGKTLATDMTQVEVVGEDAFWLVNEYADNLQALGRMDDAITAMDRVLALGLDRYPVLVSLAVNRGELLIAAGRAQAGFDRLVEIETNYFDKLSDYGKMWVWANKACALRELHRDADADAMDARLAKSPETNWSAVTAAAVCRKDTKAIGDLVISRMRDPDSRADALGLFIVDDTPEARTPYAAGRREVLLRALALPAVQAEFAKYGRPIHEAGTGQGRSEF